MLAFLPILEELELVPPRRISILKYGTQQQVDQEVCLALPRILSAHPALRGLLRIYSLISLLRSHLRLRMLQGTLSSLHITINSIKRGPEQTTRFAEKTTIDLVLQTPCDPIRRYLRIQTIQQPVLVIRRGCRLLWEAVMLPCIRWQCIVNLRGYHTLNTTASTQMQQLDMLDLPMGIIRGIRRINFSNSPSILSTISNSSTKLDTKNNSSNNSSLVRKSTALFHCLVNRRNVLVVGLRRLSASTTATTLDAIKPTERSITLMHM